MTAQTRDSVESAIRNSPLQLNPVVEGEEILVRVPRCRPWLILLVAHLQSASAA